MEKEKKIQIIRAAAKRFDRHGLNKTTLDEIARDLRIGKATIYHYFTSKDELFFQVLEWEGGLLLEDLKNILSNQQITISEKLDLYFLSKGSLQARYRLVYDAVINILNDNAFEKENIFFAKLNSEEEKYLGQYLVPENKLKTENFRSVVKLLLFQSWNFLFMKKLNLLVNYDKPDRAPESLINFFIEELSKDTPV